MEGACMVQKERWILCGEKALRSYTLHDKEASCCCRIKGVIQA